MANILTIQEIISYASSLGLTFSVEDAQDVIDTEPEWYKGIETQSPVTIIK